MIKLVIANRGEIARRILRTAKARGYYVAVISTQDDKNSLVCREADEVLFVQSFLNAQEIVEKSKAFGADLLHPGYGFLSENAAFAALVENSGITFVGPTSANMKLMGSKESAKAVALKAQVPTLNALFSEELKAIPPSQWKQALDSKGILLPYLVKASGGGGGRGMRIVEKFEDLEQNLARARQEAKSAFHDETVFVERYLKHPRHIEIQIFGDGEGGGVFWGERECSLQRRHQKVIEEAPSSFVDSQLREKMGKASLSLVKETKYRGAGTLEYLVDKEKNFYFLEMNTRLQVEHPVTEMVYQIDLVDAQFDLACGKWPASFPNPTQFYLPEPKGVALEARLLAEDPKNNFLPTPGKIYFYQEPQADMPQACVRVDSGVCTGDQVNSNYDSLIAKLIVHAPTRALAIQKMKNSLENFPILGFTHNISFLRNIVIHPDFLQGKESTGWIEENLEVLNQNILKEELSLLFQSQSFREKLSLILSQNWQPTPLENLFSKLSFCDDSSLGFEIQKNNLPHCFQLNWPIKVNDDSHQSHPLLFYAIRISVSEIHLFCCGQSFILLCPRRLSLDAAHKSNSQGEMKAPMPGKLFDVLVTEGEIVSFNQVLFIVESMKIQLEVRSPCEGVVKKIHFEKGQNLAATDILATIE